MNKIYDNPKVGDKIISLKKEEFYDIFPKFKLKILEDLCFPSVLTEVSGKVWTIYRVEHSNRPSLVNTFLNIDIKHGSQRMERCSLFFRKIG